MKAFVISQPKAGTYLCANLLVNFNMVPTNMHVKNNKYRVYQVGSSLPKFATKKELKNYIKAVTYYENSFGDIVDLIPDNGFAVGHLPCEGKYINALKDVKKILLTRPYDEHQESIKRFKEEMHGDTSVNKDGYFGMLEWRNQPDVFELQFSDMIKPRLAQIRKLQNYLFGEVKYDEEQAIQRALGSPSPTKSSIR